MRIRKTIFSFFRFQRMFVGQRNIVVMEYVHLKIALYGIVTLSGVLG